MMCMNPAIAKTLNTISVWLDQTPLSQAIQANPYRLKTTKCGMSRPIRAVVVKPPVSASKRLKEPPCICRPTANTAEQAASR